MYKIYLEINGERYEGFTEISVSDSLERLSSSFAFSTTVKENNLGVLTSDIRLGDEAKVYIDDNLKLTGFIEVLNNGGDAFSESITFSGRDIGADIVDSNIRQKSYNQKNFELLINLVLKDNGFSIKVINKVGLLVLETGEIIKTKQGETIFEFLDRYAKKLQVLLKISNKGELLIMREDDSVVKNMLINNYTSDTNILYSELNLSTVNRFYSNEFYSQSNNKTHTSLGVSQKGKAIDPQIRKTRTKISVMNTATNSKTLDALARWDANLNQAKDNVYTCKVVGFYSGGKTIWQPNTLVDIIDLKRRVRGTFLVQGVQFMQNTQGSFTTLDIVEQGSFKTGVIKAFGNSFADGLIR